MSAYSRAVDRLDDPFPTTSRYRALDAIASGGMATVYVGTLRGPNGFERRVAIKRAHRHLLGDPRTRKMMLEEARIASRVDHPNVVGVRDVEDLDGELLLVMDYVEGASLSRLLADGPLPPRVAGRILLDAANGLCAVHALADSGETGMRIIHRDVSPSNILVGIDGTSRLADFGIAKGAACPVVAAHETYSGALRGKPGYMSPEYLSSGVATPMLDVFAMGIVAWEILTARRLFRGATDAETSARVQSGSVRPPSELAADVTRELDAVVFQALERDPKKRCTARELARGLENALNHAGLLGARREVTALVRERCADAIRERRERIRAAVASSPELRLTPSSGRFPIDAQSSARTGRESGTPRARPAARDLAGSISTSKRRAWPAKIGMVTAMLCGVALAVFGARASFHSSVAAAQARVVAPASAAAAPAIAATSETASVLAPAPAVATSVTALTAAALDAPSLPLKPPVVDVTSLPRSAAPASVAPAAVAPPPPLDCEGLSERAEARRAAGDLVGAEALYKQAIALNSRYLPARIAVADLEWEQGRTARARGAYRSLVEQFAPEMLAPRVFTRGAQNESDPE